MRRVVLMAVLALALPVAAFANSIDYQNIGGTVSGTDATGLTFTSTLSGVMHQGGSAILGNLGTVTITAGAVTSGTLTGNATLGPGTITITGNGTNGIANGVLFTSSFQSATWTVTTFSGSGTHQYTFVANMGNNQTIQTTFNIGKGFFAGSADLGSGDTTVVVPEPGTLGLLGTGLVGIAGLIRRKIKLG